jgi:hypothetical protein
MRKVKAWLFVTLDGVIEAPENWVVADDDMFAAAEADYATWQRGPECGLDEQHPQVRGVNDPRVA